MALPVELMVYLLDFFPGNMVLSLLFLCPRLTKQYFALIVETYSRRMEISLRHCEMDKLSRIKLNQLEKEMAFIQAFNFNELLFTKAIRLNHFCQKRKYIQATV